MTSKRAPLESEYDTLDLRVRALADQPDGPKRASVGLEDDDVVFELDLEHRNPKSLGRTKPVEGEWAVFNTRRLLERKASPEDYGDELARQLLWSPTAKAYFDNSRSAAQGAGRCLRISLDVEPQSEPEALRWELMRVAEGLTVGSSQELAFSRFLAASSHDFRPVLAREKTQLRALVAIATLPEDNGRDLAEVNFESELRVVEDALSCILGGQKPRSLGSVDQSFSLDELVSELRDGVNVLYLVAHGRFSKKGEPALLLADDFDEDGRWVRAAAIATEIARLLPEQLPRLVVLASCQGAGDERGMVHATLAGRLVAAGVPAVLGMQGFITVETVGTMMPVLFEELDRDGRIDRALAVARGRAQARPDAWMPALFTRLVDGRLWSQSGDAPAQPLPERLRAAFAASPVPQPPPAEAQPLFGRDAQLDELLACVRKARTDGPQACVVLGDIGTGKTALARELLTRALDEDPNLVGLYADNASSPLLQQDPYLVIQELMLWLLGDVEEGRPPSAIEALCIERCRALSLEHAETIVETAPALLSAMAMKSSCFWSALAAGGGSEGIDDDEPSSFETSELLLEFSGLLSALAGSRPLLLVVENVQWVDRASIAMLADFVRRSAGVAVTLVVTCRPAELESDGPEHPFSSMLQSLARSPRATIVDLDEVSSEQRDQVVDGLLDAEPNTLAPEFRATLRRRTDGNPLFTLLLLSALKDRGDLVLDEQQRWCASETLAWDELPSALSAAVGERLSNLSDELRQILEVASVDGLTFRVRSLAELLERKEIQLLPMLSRQLDGRHRLIEDSGRQWVGGRKLAVFRFTHPMVQQYLYDHLSGNERRLYHAHVAKLLETLFEDELDEVALLLAHHYQQADEPIDAAGYWRQAAARATRLGASDEALVQLDRGLSLTRQLPKAQRKRRVLALELELEIERAAVLKVTKGWNADETVAAYEHARSLAEEIEALADLVPILFGLWAIELCRPDLGRAAELASRCSEIGQQLDESGILLQALIARGNTHFWRGEVELAHATTSEALALFDPIAHARHLVDYGQDPRSLAYQFLLGSLALLDRPDEAREHRDQMIATMQALKHPFSWAISLYNAVWVSWLLGDLDECRRWCEKLIELCLPDRFPAYLGLGQMFLAGVDAIQGRGQDARARLEEAWRERVSYIRVAHSIYRTLDAEVCWSTGDRTAALDAVRDGQRFAEDHGLHCFRAEMLRMEATFVQAEDPQGSIALLERAIELARGQNIRLFESRASTQLESLRAASNGPPEPLPTT